MSNSGINFKVYCVNGENTEVKRFFVDADAVTSFVFMKEKIKSIFPNLQDGDLKITWKDADGDYISITCDDDFITALTEMNENPKVLYVSAEQKNSNDDPRQFRVICDVCQKGISGYRYKCIECPDYDLCATCEGNGHHAEHMVLRLPNSAMPVAKLDRKMMFNAARALKKSAFTVAREAHKSAFSAAKEAHRCARESFRGGDKEKPYRFEEMGTSSGQQSAYSCPFATADIGAMIAQNINPFLEVLSKGPSNPTNMQEGPEPNPISELVRSVAEAFTGLVNAEQPTKPNNEEPTKEQSVPTQQTPPEQAPPSDPAQSNTKPSAPPANTVNNTASQEMEWTIVNDSESSSQASVSSQTSTTQPPQPPQDPRLMRGLAQLYEMGFSNENHFLNYMLESHNYNVADVVKAILELK